MSGLPEGWRQESIAELAVGGLFTDGDWVETKDQDPCGSVRLTQLADVGVGTFRDRSNRWLREDQAARLGCTYLMSGDVLIARMPDPIGRACQVPPGIGRAVTVVDVAVLRPTRGEIDSRYVMWAINSPKVHEQIAALQSGTTRKRVSRKNLASVRIPIPTLPEQRRIVEILEDHLSRLDAAEDRLNAVSRRLDVLRTSALLETTDDLTAEGLPSLRIDSVSTTALGKMLDARRASGTPAPYLRNINVRWGHVNLDDVSTVPLSEEERVRFELKDGDVLVCEGGEPGRCAVWRGDGRLMTYQKALHRLRVDPALISPEFLALSIEAFIRSGRADRLFTGTTIKHLPQEKLRAITVPVPSLELQTRVVGRMEQLEISRRQMMAERDRVARRTGALRRGLLAAAFSGQLTGRSSDLDLAEERALARSEPTVTGG